MSRMKRIAEQLDGDLFGALEAKDAALEQVAEHSGDFMADARYAVSRLPSGLYTGEAIRLEIEARGICPHHHNAWGALISKCVKDGMLKPTGRYLPMRTRKSHARKTPEYRR